MKDFVAIQPIAAIEQHGPHLPVSVDADINAGMMDAALARLPSQVPVLALPALNIGKSDEHESFPGTLTIKWQALADVWFSIGESVQRTGCKKIIFFNSHGGQPQLLDIVCRDLRGRFDMLAVAATWFSMIDMSDVFDEKERVHGIHGGDIETSAMLHLAPERVNMEKAANLESASVAIHADYAMLRSEGSVGFGWHAQDLHDAGVTGNAALASAEKGRLLVERAAQALATLALETARFPLSDLRNRRR